MAAGRIHNFAFFLLTFYFLKLINQFESIMQNKPNLPNAQMNVNTIKTKDCENKRLADAAKTNPIYPYRRGSKPNGGGGIRTPVPRCFKASFYMHSRFIIFFASLSAKRQARKLAISVFLAGVDPNNRLGQSAI